MGAAFFRGDFRFAAIAATNGIPQRVSGYLTKGDVMRPHLVKRAVLAIVGDSQHFEARPAQQDLRIFARAVPGIIADYKDIGTHAFCSGR